MSENKAIELQLQMRQNAEDLHNFMKDLDSWETDIKRKDEQLRTGSVGVSQVCNTWKCVCFMFSYRVEIVLCYKDPELCIPALEKPPTSAKQGLQKEEGEKEGIRQQCKDWTKTSTQDKVLWLSVMGQIWCGNGLGGSCLFLIWFQ